MQLAKRVKESVRAHSCVCGGCVYARKCVVKVQTIHISEKGTLNSFFLIIFNIISSSSRHLTITNTSLSSRLTFVF